MLEFLRVHSWSYTFSTILLYINDLPDDVICNIAIYADGTTLYSKCDHASDMWQKQELASELELYRQDAVDWGRKWFADFNAGKTQLAVFDQSNNTGAFDVKMVGSVFEKKSSFQMQSLIFFSKFDWGSYIISIAKNCLRKNWSLDSFNKISFSRGCSVSL